MDIPRGDATLQKPSKTVFVSSSSVARRYGCQLPALVDAWRGLFGDDFAFGFVSLAGFVSNGTQYPMTRYRMQATTDKALTFSATAYDLGDADSPHGGRAELVARRS